MNSYPSLASLTEYVSQTQDAFDDDFDTLQIQRLVSACEAMLPFVIVRDGVGHKCVLCDGRGDDFAVEHTADCQCRGL